MADMTGTNLGTNSLSQALQSWKISEHLVEVGGQDYIWSHPDHPNVEVAQRGTTGVLLEAYKFLALTAGPLLDLKLQPDVPRSFYLGNNLLVHSWSPGLAFDLKKQVIVQVPISAIREEKLLEFSFSEEDQEVLKIENREQMIGKAAMAKQKLENYKEILKLKKQYKALRKQKWIVIEEIYNMREDHPKVVNKIQKQLISFTDFERDFSRLMMNESERIEKLEIQIERNKIGYFCFSDRYELEKNNKYDKNIEREIRDPFVFLSGGVYHGEWKGNFRDGYGEQKWKYQEKYRLARDICCDSYVGNWSRNRANGVGKLKQTLQTIEGEFSQDKVNGIGHLCKENEADFYGELRESLPEGKGLMKRESHSLYLGNFRAGEPEGLGEEEGMSGPYTGQWRRGSKEGLGLHKNCQGNIYRGQFREGHYYGLGQMTFENGNLYQGSWIHNQRQGLGFLFDKELNKTQFGIWEINQLIKELTEEDVQKIIEDKEYYLSFFKDNAYKKLLPLEFTFKDLQGFQDDLMRVQISVNEIVTQTEQLVQTVKNEKYEERINEMIERLKIQGQNFHKKINKGDEREIDNQKVSNVFKTMFPSKEEQSNLQVNINQGQWGGGKINRTNELQNTQTQVQKQPQQSKSEALAQEQAYIRSSKEALQREEYFIKRNIANCEHQLEDLKRREASMLSQVQELDRRERKLAGEAKARSPDVPRSRGAIAMMLMSQRINNQK